MKECRKFIDIIKFKLILILIFIKYFKFVCFDTHEKEETCYIFFCISLKIILINTMYFLAIIFFK